MPKKERAAATGGFDPKRLPGYVKDMTTLQGEIDAIMQAAKDECAPLREQLAAIKKRANEDANLPRKELNAIVTKRRLLAKAENIRGTLSKEQQDNFDQMELALDETSETVGSGAGTSKSQPSVTH